MDVGGCWRPSVTVPSKSLIPSVLLGAGFAECILDLDDAPAPFAVLRLLLLGFLCFTVCSTLFRNSLGEISTSLRLGSCKNTSKSSGTCVKSSVSIQHHHLTTYYLPSKTLRVIPATPPPHGWKQMNRPWAGLLSWLSECWVQWLGPNWGCPCDCQHLQWHAKRKLPT